MRRALVIIAGAVLAALSTTGCGTGGAAEAAPSPTAPAAAAPPSASGPTALPADLGYVDYAPYAAHRGAFDRRKVVLFYWASWCPSCAGHEATIRTALRAHTLPLNLSIVKVDYDDNDVRKIGYEVLQQDTFVLVDRTGKALRPPLVGPAYAEILDLAA